MFIQSSGLHLFISSSVISSKLPPLAEEKSETIEVIKVEDEEDKEREDDNDEEEEGGDVLSRLRSEKEEGGTDERGLLQAEGPGGG